MARIIYNQWKSTNWATCNSFLNEEMKPVRKDTLWQHENLKKYILFNMTNNSTDSLDDLVRMSVKTFVWVTPGELLGAPFENSREDDIEHLLGLLHYCCCSEFHSMVSPRNIVEIKDKSLKSTKELQEAGIKFKKIEGRNLFNIRFVNGTMEIPTLIIDDDTEFFFRNLIAYEQRPPHTSRNYFTAYNNFLDCLVNTSKDVEILTHHRIIHKVLGDNEVVATMLNKLGNYTIRSDVGYEDVYSKANEHCRGNGMYGWGS
ncbi:uncharacterized protein LOC114311592 [Camellia sinensis]|uniref:uncharacterized protein LOC114311592 n=1 Tax=Camellia sinensis TaxID=4442 RepID=UPI0010365350|nr:uncharacterized protein LOC114311592 [Camellia sinensis]